MCDCRKDVDIFCELVDNSSVLLTISRITNESEYVVTLWKESELFFKPMIAELLAVIGSDDDHGVFPHT